MSRPAREAFSPWWSRNGGSLLATWRMRLLENTIIPPMLSKRSGLESNCSPFDHSSRLLKNRSDGSNSLKQMDKASEPPSCLAPSVFMIGQDRKGHWVAQEPSGTRGGLFVNRGEVLKFIKSEGGTRPHAIVWVSGILELNTGFAPTARSNQRPADAVSPFPSGGSPESSYGRNIWISCLSERFCPPMPIRCPRPNVISCVDGEAEHAQDGADRSG